MGWTHESLDLTYGLSAVHLDCIRVPVQPLYKGVVWGTYYGSSICQARSL